MRSVLILYIPALHESYIQLFNRYTGRADVLYILGTDVINQFPILEREIRAMQPETVKQLLKSADYFPHVEIADSVTLEQIAQDTSCEIVMTDEHISDELRAKYFTERDVTVETLFLRIDEKIVKAARKEIEYTGMVTEKEFDKEIMQKALTEAERSSDWFMRVGAALILNDSLIDTAHNTRMPSPHEPWAVGDPRMFIANAPGGNEYHRQASLHAEQTLIAHAARDGVAIKGASMYVSVFPCATCVNCMAEAGIKRCYFKDGYCEAWSTDVFKAYDMEVIKVV